MTRGLRSCQGIHSHENKTEGKSKVAEMDGPKEGVRVWWGGSLFEGKVWRIEVLLWILEIFSHEVEVVGDGGSERQLHALGPHV